MAKFVSITNDRRFSENFVKDAISEIRSDIAKKRNESLSPRTLQHRSLKSRRYLEGITNEEREEML